MLPINWKLINDANHEAYHVPFVHPGLVNAYNVAKHFGVVDPEELRGDGGVERGANMSPDVNGYTFMANEISGELLAMEPNQRGPFSRVIGALGGTADYRRIKRPWSASRAATNSRTTSCSTGRVCRTSTSCPTGLA
ncbi:SRPBCC family protein [Streptomyces sp. INA 01156]